MLRSARLRRLLGVGLLAAVLVLIAGPASAHAVLESSTPGQGALLQAPPADVVLRFDEAVTLLPTSVRVFAPDGARADSGVAGHDGGDASTAEVGFTGTARGTYLVSWRVVSADSHPVSGAFTFSIGRAGRAPTAAALSNDPAVAGLLGVARWLGYAGSALFVGGLAFGVLCWRAGPQERAYRRVLVGGGLALAVSAVLMLLAKGALDAGLGLSAFGRPSLVHEVVRTTYGKAALARIVLGLLAVSVSLHTPRLHPVQRCGALVGLGVLTALSFSVAGHAEAASPRTPAVAVDALHVLAMSVWLGGLVAMAVALRRVGEPARRERIAQRFSRVALVAVGVLAGSGIYQGWREVRSWGALTGTPYGRELLIKAVLVAAVVAVAAVSRQVLWRGGVARIGRTVAIEAAGIAAVLGVTSVLVATQPAYSAYHPDVSANLMVEGDLVQVSAVPDGDRTMALHLYLFRHDRPSDPKAISATVTLPSRNVGPLPVTLDVAGPGHRLGTVQVPIAGTWQLAVTVRTSAIDEGTGYVTMPIH